MKRVPSNWTLKMFLSAAQYGLHDDDPVVSKRVARDLHDILFFTFTYWKNLPFKSNSVDYRKYNTELYKEL